MNTVEETECGSGNPFHRGNSNEEAVTHQKESNQIY